MSSRDNYSASREWKSATDPKSGRIYYYNVRTKETTWTKPLELASPEERESMIMKKKETIQFFREMEANIRNRIQKARYDDMLKASVDYNNDIIYREDSKDAYGDRGRLNSYGSSDGNRSLAGSWEGRSRLNSFGSAPRRVRTISTMDDEILLTMRQSTGEDRRSTMYAKNKMQQIAEEKTGKFESAPARKLEAKDTSSVSKKPRTGTAPKRRNSTGTIYITTTMSKQNNDITIECVCVVIRAHMISAAKENIVPLPEYDIFKDTAFAHKRDFKDSNPMALIPSLQAVKEFFTIVFSKSQLESDCIIMALIYCERLVKETKGRLCIRYDNWRSILFACLVMASKVWDDLSMWNVDFSQVYPSFDLARVNALELAMLEALKYVIRVSASEYAKYYFHLRSMMVRLGLQSSEPNFIEPLDLAGARKLQLSTEKYEEYNNSSASVTRRRHNSMHDGMMIAPLSLQRNYSDGYDPSGKAHSIPVQLEQIIHSEHMDADGQVHLTRKQSNQNVLSPTKKATPAQSKSPIRGSSHHDMK